MFEQALSALQSDKSYMPEESGEIKCYLKTGETISIPEYFYIENVNRFKNHKEAEAWVLERDKRNKENQKKHLAFGTLIANPNLPVEEQVLQALDAKYPQLIDASQNKAICQKVAMWRDAAIDALAPRKKRYSLQELLTQCDPYTAHADELAELLPSELEAESVQLDSDSSENSDLSDSWMIARMRNDLQEYYDVAKDDWFIDPAKATKIKSVHVANFLLATLATEFSFVIPAINEEQLPGFTIDIGKTWNDSLPVY